MKVSVIIPTRNAGEDFDQLLGMLSSQTLVPYEILVIDSSSVDGTPERAKRHGVKVVSIPQEEFDHGGTRNFGSELASGEILVFMTQDAVPADRTFLEALVRPFEDADIAAAYGRQIAKPQADPLERMTREFNYSDVAIRKSMVDVERLGIKAFFFTNVCSAVRHEVFDSLGRFPAPIILNEDMILAAKCLLAGYSVMYVPDAKVLHSHQYTLMQQFRRYFDIGVSLRMNEWLLDYTRPEGEGKRLLKSQWLQLARPRLWPWIPKWMMESITKYAGYRMGLAYKRLSMKMIYKCTMHKGFWNRTSASTATVLEEGAEFFS